MLHRRGLIEHEPAMAGNLSESACGRRGVGNRRNPRPRRWWAERTGDIVATRCTEEPFADWRGPEAAQVAGERGMYDGVPRLPGKSLVPLLTGRADAVQDAVLIENDEDYRGLSLRTLVTGGAIYTRYRGNRYGPSAPATDIGP